MKPQIHAGDFVVLQTYKSFYIKDLASLMIPLSLNVDRLFAECQKNLPADRRPTKNQVKRAIAKDPVIYDHARGIIDALERVRQAANGATPQIQEDEHLVGAVFYVRNLFDVCDRNKIGRADLAKSLRNQQRHRGASADDLETAIADLMKGSRVTLIFALDVIDTINEIFTAASKPLLDATTAIVTDISNPRRAPVKSWQVIEQPGHDVWPPVAP